MEANIPESILKGAWCGGRVPVLQTGRCVVRKAFLELRVVALSTLLIFFFFLVKHGIFWSFVNIYQSFEDKKSLKTLMKTLMKLKTLMKSMTSNRFYLWRKFFSYFGLCASSGSWSCWPKCSLLVKFNINSQEDWWCLNTAKT